MTDNKRIGVIIPAYNEERSIGSTIQGALQYCSDVVVVNDGSQDNTETIATGYPVTVLSHTRNRGLLAAVRSGFQYMLENGYDFAIKIDADGQMDATMLDVFRSAVEKDPSIDAISATYNPDTPWMIRKDMQIYSFLLWICTGIHTTDVLSEFRLYSRRAMKYIVAHIGKSGYDSPLMVIDLLRNRMMCIETSGGVSYSRELIRPFPIDAQLALRTGFLTRVLRFRSLRSALGSLLATVVFALLLVFNVVTGPQYHSILPKKYLR